jgi:hypothetical protein
MPERGTTGTIAAVLDFDSVSVTRPVDAEEPRAAYPAAARWKTTFRRLELASVNEHQTRSAQPHSREND